MDKTEITNLHLFFQAGNHIIPTAATQHFSQNINIFVKINRNKHDQGTGNMRENGSSLSSFSGCLIWIQLALTTHLSAVENACQM
jgi:hypothetical protein